MNPFKNINENMLKELKPKKLVLLGQLELCQNGEIKHSAITVDYDKYKEEIEKKKGK